jgi:CDP-4-dehydro-6-deoxyglucose reductase, E3
MARNIYQFKINKIIDHTDIIRELDLEISNYEEFSFKAGQFIMLHVPTETDKPALRAYSIATTDEFKKGFRLIFKFVENGVASKFVWSLKGQEILNITGPFGKVFFQEPPTEQVIFLSTGSGLSQHFSFIESNFKKFPHLKYRILLGLRYEKDIYYQKELENLKSKVSNLQFEYVLSRPTDQWTGKKGYIQNHISDFDYKNVPSTFYICGNGAMIKDLKKQLIEVDGIDKSKIWAEAFD